MENQLCSRMKEVDFVMILDNGTGTSGKGMSQSVCVKAEEMNFMIRDTATGTYYDPKELCNTILSDENLTKLSPHTSKKPWEEWWETKSKNNKGLLREAENGDANIVMDLLDRSKHGDLAADVNTKGLNECAPLHLAASEGHLEIVKILLKMGANVDALSNLLRTPLHSACIRGYSDIIEILLQSKANVNAQDRDGCTPIHFLAEGGWVEGIAICLKCNPDFTIKNIYGETPNEVAASLEVRELLVPLKVYSKSYEEVKKDSNAYARTVVQNVIVHNNRADMVKALFFKTQRINGGDAMLESPSKNPPTPGTPGSNGKSEPKESKEALPKAKSRRVKIIQAAKELSSVKIDQPNKTPEDEIGLHSFDIIQVLGKGSFGEVYLVRYKPLNKPYAMKVLNKKRFMSQNLLRYAKAERNVLCFIKSPFIVGLDFAFQTSDKLFLILEFCPG